MLENLPQVFGVLRRTLATIEESCVPLAKECDEYKEKCRSLTEELAEANEAADEFEADVNRLVEAFSEIENTLLMVDDIVANRRS